MSRYSIILEGLPMFYKMVLLISKKLNTTLYCPTKICYFQSLLKIIITFHLSKQFTILTFSCQNHEVQKIFKKYCIYVYSIKADF